MFFNEIVIILLVLSKGNYHVIKKFTYGGHVEVSLEYEIDLLKKHLFKYNKITMWAK